MSKLGNRVGLYYKLVKPGIVKGNAVHTLAGALLAASWVPEWQPIIGVLIGTSLVIASACVVNNYIDRKMDVRMARTKDRASATGKIRLRSGMLFAALLLIAGFAVLYALTNVLVLIIGVVAYLTYVLAYTLSKPHTVHSTLIGAIPGALPAMAGYVAVSGEITVGAWLVFLLIAVWQLPHFYAISIFRKKEYKAAGVPVLAVVKPFAVVKAHILFYQIVYASTVAALIALKVVAPPVGLLLLAGAAYWLYVFTRSSKDEAKWAKSIFGASLLLTLSFPVAGVINMFLHTN